MPVRRHWHLAAVGIMLAVFARAGAQESAAVFYASPTGNGNCRSVASACRVERFWNIAKPGSTLWLLDGHYRGSDSMIVPPPSLRGVAGNAIRLRALHDGKVLIDGERKLRPVWLRKSEYLTIEGINACCSSHDVVLLSATKGVEVRRVVGWDAAADQNAMIFSIAYGQRTLLEDTAGFGSARKTYQYSQAPTGPPRIAGHGENGTGRSTRVPR